MRNKLIPSLAVASFSLAASGLAFAADIAVKAPPPAPAPVYNWTGWYVGGNIGASFGTFKTDYNVASSAFEALEVGPVLSAATIPGFAGRDEVYPGGLVGGGQIGFNWQLSPLWVVGVEGDFQGTDERGHGSPSQNFTASLFAIESGPFAPASTGSVTGTTTLNYAAKIEWFGTARLRAGYLFGDGTQLAYVTGGLAYGKVDVGGSYALSATFTPTGSTVSGQTSFNQAFNHSNVNTGWVIGSGTEGKLGIPNWTYKIEGLYMDLGHLAATAPGGSAGGAIPDLALFGVLAGPVHTNTHFTDTILRAGLNYQFH